MSYIGKGVEVVTFNTATTLDVAGNITVGGTVDGRDVATDGTKLDTITSGAIADIVQDTTPQLGGNLDLNTSNVIGTGNINVTGSITGTSFVSTGDMSFTNNSKAIFGTSPSLEIYHDGSNSILDDVGAGNFKMQLAGADKLEITSTGVDVTGTVTADGLTVDGTASTSITSTNGNTLNLYRSGTGSDSVAINFYDGSNDRSQIKSSDGGLSFHINGTSRAVDITSGGNVGIGTASPQGLLDVGVSGATSNQFLTGGVGNNAVTGVFKIGSGAGRGASIQGFRGVSSNVHSLDFYTYNSADVFAMRIDSSGNVGIGTSSPTSNRQLTLYGNDAGLQMTGSGAGSNVYLTSTPGSGANFFFGTTSAKPIIFVTNGATTERMRIDSSGNVLVGTTSTGPGLGNTNTGIQFQQSGVGVLSMSNEPTLYVNRNGTDGTIAQFRKNGSTVGSIGTAFDDIYVGNSDVGLLLNASGDNIWPFNTGTQSVRDNAIDLGYNGGRFKDLYLSGGVYLGGTGSANHLDDYEEGTWNPTIIGSSTNPTVTYGSSTSGRYTKIGRVVMLKCDIAVAAISGGSGSARINGVPFNSSGFPAWDSAVFRDADAIKISGQTSRVTGWVGNGVFYITYVGSFTANCGDADLPISSIGTGRIQFTTWFTV